MLTLQTPADFLDHIGQEMGAATRLTTHCVIELEGSERPAVVAEFILRMQDR